MSPQRKTKFKAKIATARPDGSGVTINDFVAYLPAHHYFFMPCREPWPASSIDSCLERVQVLTPNGQPKRAKNGKLITIRASAWLDRNQSVEQMTWAPGFPTLIRDRLAVHNGWIEREGVTTLNLYRPPRVEPGDASKATRWIEHFHKIYPDNAEHCIDWLAHRVQQPEEKINHGIVLGGAQGIGKDSLLAAVRYAVGAWNYGDISPTQLIGRFNPFAKNVVLRINEGHDLGDINRYTLYDRAKQYTAAPPETLPVDEKNLRLHYVVNCVGLVITTNHQTDGIYLPKDDRRFYVMWSTCRKEDFTRAYWNEFWKWYRNGGLSHVATYLAERNLSNFDPKAPPPQTVAFWDIVNANSIPECAGLTDVIDNMGKPRALTVKQLVADAPAELADWLIAYKNRRAIPHRLADCGYVSVRNPDAKDGFWKIQGVRQMIYAQTDLAKSEQLEAARAFS